MPALNKLLINKMKYFCLVKREKVQLFVTERDFAVSSSLLCSNQVST